MKTGIFLPRWTYRFVTSEKVDLVQGGFKSDPFLNIGFGVNYKFGSFNGKSTQEERDDEPRDERQQREYKRLDFEGPDIMEISTDFDFKGTTQRSSSNGNAQGFPEEESASERRQREMQEAENKSGGNRQQQRSSNDFDQGLVFSVQVLAVSKQVDISQWKQQYNIRRNIAEVYSGGLYRYFAGTFDTYQAAEVYADIARTKGVGGAFVVALRDGNRVKLTSPMEKQGQII
ncbi:MAG: hypothetical protein U5L09_15275 [Bacteroidales bacterium]|nr:hypothetical protein [Bacteroidales bacterium]